jgi:hypothetical protein
MWRAKYLTWGIRVDDPNRTRSRGGYVRSTKITSEKPRPVAHPKPTVGRAKRKPGEPRAQSSSRRYPIEGTLT